MPLPPSSQPWPMQPRRKTAATSLLLLITLISSLLLSVRSAAANSVEAVVTISNAQILEGNSGTRNLAFTVALNAPASTDVSMTVETVAAIGSLAATPGSDYTTLASSSLTFASGERSKTVNVVVLGDTVDELNEIFFVRLSSLNGPAIFANSGTEMTGMGTIEDDDGPTVSINDVTVNESAANATFTVSLSAASSQNVFVNWAASNGTATAGQDYTAASGTLLIPTGEVTRTITIALQDDLLDEVNETFNVNLSNPVNGTLADSAGLATIEDNDVPSVSFSVASSSVDEAAGTVNITVALDRAAAGSVSVDYAVAAGSTATGGGTDYTLANGTLTFTSGITSTTIAVAINNDSLAEPNETVVIDLSNPTAGDLVLGGITSHTLTINDNDLPVVTFATTASSINESNATQTVSVTVNLSNMPDRTVTVPFSIDGTAQPADYTLAPISPLVFNAGQQSQTIAIDVTGDLINETSQTLVLTLGGASLDGAIIGSDNTYTLTINDDDAPPTVQFGAATSSIAENAGPATITVTLAGNATEQTVTVNYGVTGGTAQPADYSLANGTLTFIPGDTSESISVGITNDAMYEGDQTVVIGLNSPTIATAGSPDAHTLTITDDDPMPVVSFATATSTVAENVGTTTIRANLDRTAEVAVTVPFSVGGASTAANPADYSISGTSITIPAGSSSGTISVSVENDLVYESHETLIVTLDSATNATLGSPTTHTLTILDNEQPTVAFTTTSSSRGEGDSPLTQDVTVRLSEPVVAGRPVTVPFTVSGTAQGADYSLSTNGPLEFAAGEQEKTITITVVDDSINEANQTVVLTLGGAGLANTTVGTDAAHTLTITDNDTAPTVQFELDPAESSIDEDAGPATINVTLAGNATEQAVTVDYDVVAGGTAQPADYSLTNGTLTFTPGQTSKPITVGITNDSVYEGDQTVVIELSNPTVATAASPTAHTLTITDDETMPTVSFGSASSSANEDAGTTNVQVRLSSSVEGGVSIPFSLSGTASEGAGDDFTASASPLVFAESETSKDILITIQDDTVYELAETVVITLDAPTNATRAAPSIHTLTINASDRPTVQYSSSSLSVAENAGTATVTVELTDAVLAGDSITVGIVMEGASTASQGADFDFPPTSALTFGPGERTKDVVLTINNDLRDEADETIVLGFSTRAANSTTVVGNANVTITITDDDVAPTTAADNYSVAEDAVLTVAASGVLSNDSDGDGTPFTAALVSDVSNGTLTLNADGSFSYTPKADFFGSDSFSYKAVDSGTNESAAATVTITVTPVNDAPVAANDTASVSIDSRDNQLVVLGNDTDVDGDTLRITAVTAATHGSISVSSDGLHLLYTPTPGYEGSDQASYTMSDGNGGTATATVNINVVRFRLFLPMISNPGVADLSTRISVSPDRESPTDKVLVSVTVTNNGTAPASGFWVDLYINPSRVPQVNEPWSDLCAVERCEGLAWFVATPLAPGQSITLVSMPQDNETPNGYSQENSRWRGLLPNGVVQLHAYADSWNRDAGGAERSPFGAVYERNESNNGASLELRDLE